MADLAPGRLTIIALHGNGGGGFRFDRLHSFVPSDVTLICPTLPGFAMVPRAPSLTRVSQYADLLRPMVEHAGPPVVLLGHGIGGSIALDYLQRHSDTVSGLILHSPVGAMLDKRLFPALLNLPGAAEFGKRVFASRLFRKYFTGRLFLYPVPEQYLDRFFEEYAHCEVFSQMFKIIDVDWFRSLAPVQTPSAILWGELDNVLSTAQLEAFLPLVGDPLISRPKSWDHFPMCDMPAEYMEHVAELARKLLESRR